MIMRRRRGLTEFEEQSRRRCREIDKEVSVGLTPDLGR